MFMLVFCLYTFLILLFFTVSGFDFYIYFCLEIIAT